MTSTQRTRHEQSLPIEWEEGIWVWNDGTQLPKLSWLEPNVGHGCIRQMPAGHWAVEMWCYATNLKLRRNYSSLGSAKRGAQAFVDVYR